MEEGNRKALTQESGAKVLTENALSEDRKQALLQDVWKLDIYPGELGEETILSLIRELQTGMYKVEDRHDLFALELYYAVSARLLCRVRQLGLCRNYSLEDDIAKLYDISAYASWQDAFGCLRQLAETIYNLKKQNEAGQTRDVVTQVKEYVREHLGGDTSLAHLAGQVHFSQEYLLRTFKKREGITILQYVNEQKLSAARQLLRDTKLPVREIVRQLGFAGQGYFGRFFRKKTGFTPNAWREYCSTIKQGDFIL